MALSHEGPFRWWYTNQLWPPGSCVCLWDVRTGRRPQQGPRRLAPKAAERTATMCSSIMLSSEVWRAASADVRQEDTALLEAVLTRVATSREASTLQSYTTPWSRFVDFCQSRTPPYAALPAKPIVVAMYLAHVAGGAESYSVVKTASAAIYNAHRMAGYTDHCIPTKHQFCKVVRESAKRELGLRVKNRKAPLALGDLIALVGYLAPMGAPVWCVSLAAMAMTCFAAFLRYDDASKVLVGDVKFYPDRMEIFLEKRKNDQFREGDVIFVVRGKSVACPVALCERLVREGRLLPIQPLFQGFDGRKAASKQGFHLVPLNGQPITYDQAHYQILKYVAKVVGVSVEDAKRTFGLHSLRGGGATEVAAVLAKAGIAEHAFQAHGGWASREAMLVYITRFMPAKLDVTRAMGY